MTLRTTSRAEHLGICMMLSVAALIAYVILVVTFEDGENMLLLLRPDRMRYFLPVALVFGLLAYEMRWDGVVRNNRGYGRSRLPRTQNGPRRATVGSPKPERVGGSSSADGRRPVGGAVVWGVKAPGREEFIRARQMPHGTVPNYISDGAYLDLLARSAECGYSPALEKLGDYAMRRKMWVEAYFWMWRARRAGGIGLDSALRTIRFSWAQDGYPDEMENVHRIFTAEMGSVARAVINIDSGRETALSRAFLREKCPEFLSR